MTSPIQLLSSSSASPPPHSLSKCQPATQQNSASQSSTTESTNGPSTSAVSSHKRLENSSDTYEASQPADPVAEPIARRRGRNPDLGSPEGLSEWLRFSCHQMDPACVSPYRHQVAGHGSRSRNDSVSMLRDRDNCIYKPSQPPPKGLNEIRFYKTLWADELLAQPQDKNGAQSEGQVDEQPETQTAPLSAAIRRFRRWVPRYYGVHAISAERLAAICAGSRNKSRAEPSSHQTLYFLRLEDTLGRLRWPSVVDLKMGRVSYERSASAAKRREENSKYEFRDQVGFLLSGMRVFDWRTHDYMLYERNFGRVLRTDEIASVALNEFLPLPGSSPGRDPRAIREEPSDDQLPDGVHVDTRAKRCTGGAEGESKGFKSEACDNEAANEAAELRALRRALVRRFLVKLRALLADYEQQREQHIIASSILLAYDYIAPAERAAACRALDALSDAGDDGFCNPNSCSSSNMSCPSRSLPGIPPVGSNSINSDQQTRGQCVLTCTETATLGTKSSTAEVTDVVVRMIDFAHVEVPEPPGSPDENVLYGIRNLIRYFETLLEP